MWMGTRVRDILMKLLMAKYILIDGTYKKNMEIPFR